MRLAVATSTPDRPHTSSCDRFRCSRTLTDPFPDLATAGDDPFVGWGGTWHPSTPPAP